MLYQSEGELIYSLPVWRLLLSVQAQLRGRSYRVTIRLSEPPARTETRAAEAPAGPPSTSRETQSLGDTLRQTPPSAPPPTPLSPNCDVKVGELGGGGTPPAAAVIEQSDAPLREVLPLTLSHLSDFSGVQPPPRWAGPGGSRAKVPPSDLFHFVQQFFC